MAASSSMNSGSIAVSVQTTAPANVSSTVSAPLSSGPRTTLPFILIPTSQASEFDAEFLSKNASLLRRLKAQQARDEEILGLRTRLFHEETPVRTMGPTIFTPPTFSTVVTSETYTGYVQGSSRCHSPRSLIPGNGRPRASFGGIALFIQFGSGNFNQDRCYEILNQSKPPHFIILDTWVKPKFSLQIDLQG
ncbi:hypothetical protein HanIR_Chr07g0334351 [Helianthus annuus]|nr:hypothetical protein HanIR_Chr07g0334351 [Helianthus annuus]